jgi:hypothetical protein
MLARTVRDHTAFPVRAGPCLLDDVVFPIDLVTGVEVTVGATVVIQGATQAVWIIQCDTVLIR